MGCVAVVGASGFVGKALIEDLVKSTPHKIIALSRSDRTKFNTDRIEWRQCDLYSLLEIEKALLGADTAVYLVHSMLPSAQLVQGSFADYDLLLSDNFARAAKKLKLSHVVYLGGIIPENVKLSSHLQSRLEVEENLRTSGIKTTALRAGVIIGPGGSSFKMMENLVRRLPVMLCPKWTATLGCPVDLRDVTQSICYCIDEEKVQGKTLDLAGPEKLSYKEMMQILSRSLGLKRMFFPISYFSPGLSKLWVSLITGAPRDLVFPLVSSLRYSMIPREEHVLTLPNHQSRRFEDSLKEMKTIDAPKERPHAYFYSGSLSNHEVQSVQRITPRNPMSAKRVAQSYFKWLPKFFFPIVSVKSKDDITTFSFFGIKAPLLILKFSEERSSPDRRLYYITGGLLSKKDGKGRLEFRATLNEAVTLAAIHRFRPSLPWYVYKYTQAIIHLFTMNAFKRFLNSPKNKVTHQNASA